MRESPVYTIGFEVARSSDDCAPSRNTLLYGRETADTWPRRIEATIPVFSSSAQGSPFRTARGLISQDREARASEDV